VDYENSGDEIRETLAGFEELPIWEQEFVQFMGFEGAGWSENSREISLKGPCDVQRSY
jgi:hypothetical protein